MAGQTCESVYNCVPKVNRFGSTPERTVHMDRTVPEILLFVTVGPASSVVANPGLGKPQWMPDSTQADFILQMFKPKVVISAYPPESVCVEERKIVPVYMRTSCTKPFQRAHKPSLDSQFPVTDRFPVFYSCVCVSENLKL